MGCAYTAYYPSHLPDSDTEFSLGKYHSIFSAELCAIRNALIDLDEITNIIDHNVPTDIAVLSDSKSSLQALQRKPTSRFQKQHDIHKKIHNLHQKGHRITLAHIPSHMGIPGNDRADRLAVQSAHAVANMTGAEQVSSLDYTRDEIYSLLNKNATLKLPTYKTLTKFKTPDIPVSQRHIYYRLRTDSCYYKKMNFTSNPIRCTCNTPISIKHILSNCPHHLQLCTDILITMAKYSLTDFYQALLPHEKTGLRAAKEICQLLATSEVAYIF